MDRNRILLLALCLTGLSFSAGCRASLTEIRSHWPADPIRFTDNRSMWLSQTVIHSFGKGLQVAMGNDERNAYLFFSPGKSDNEPINRMARLTVWFYRSGSKNREVGIRYTPIPLSLQGGTRFHPEGGSNSNPGQLGMPGLQEQVIIWDRKENREISVPNDGTKGIHGPGLRRAGPLRLRTVPFPVAGRREFLRSGCQTRGDDRRGSGMETHRF